ncbi:hypothetical protein CRENBAI_015650 [Crenichthys baileyi]|uniref:Uncharacterized protein n=1 Tax=Crenichthys baileyi TaxID=28760 RepID=A0AAV9SIC7_9TELE
MYDKVKRMGNAAQAQHSNHSLEKNIHSAMVRVKTVNRQAEEKRDACQDDEQATASSTSSSEIPIGIPIITYSTDDDDDEEPISTATTTVENQTSVRPRGTSILCENPVTVYQHSPHQLNAPKKSTYYLCKVQRPPLDTLQEEWSLEPYGLKGSWGYIFMYEIGELCLYQLDQDRVFIGSLALCTLTHSDWAVLRLAIPHLNDSPETVSMQEREEEENKLSPRPAKRGRTFNMPSDVEIAKREPLFSAVWGSKTTENGRWSLRASRRMKNRTSPSDLFVLEAFNQDCGIFKTMLALPFEAWAEKMGEIGQRLSNLFHNSRSGIDVRSVKKTLTFCDSE